MFAVDDIHGIIDGKLVTTWFQPIVRASDGDIQAYEALSRGPSDSPLHAPLTMIEAAERVGRLADLERVCIEVAVARFCQLDLPGKLFINVGPESLLDPQFQNGQTQDLLRRHGMDSDRIVIELTEHRPLTNLDLIREAIELFRSKGFAIALDDLGAGYASLQLWSQLQPDFVKIDRHFITCLDEDLVKREFVRSIIEIARTLHCNVIGEGVETAGEYTTLCSLGADLLQGYFIERPLPEPPRSLEADRLASIYAPKTHDALTAKILCNERNPVPPETPVLDVANRFRASPATNAIAVVEAGVPKGIVYRHKLMELLSRPYALDLFANKTIDRVMEHGPLIVESTWRLDQVSHLVTSRARLFREDDFIIAENHTYLGIGQVIDLLKHITQLQMHTARHSNPLTLLPGTIPLHEVLDRLLMENSEFVVCYFDLNHFKPFNDIYGYAKGDEVLLRLAQILRQSLVDESEFLAHIGGDDFVAVYRDIECHERIRQVVTRFAEDAKGFYSPDHRETEGFWSSDRYGERRFHPLLTVAAGQLAIRPGDFASASAIAEALSGVKRASKLKQPDPVGGHPATAAQ